MPAEIPLPAFRQPHQLQDDPPLPTVPADQPTSPDATSPDATSPATDDRPAPPPPSLEPPAGHRTPTSSPGDPKAAAQALRGLIAIVAGTAAALLRRTGRQLRQPTREQIADVADPLGAILARHLPAEILSPDLVDVTSAAAAAHDYVLDGPLTTPIPTTHQETP